MSKVVKVSLRHILSDDFNKYWEMVSIRTFSHKVGYILSNPVIIFHVMYRLAYVAKMNRWSMIIRMFIHIFYRFLCVIYGNQISLRAFIGGGFHMVHWGGIVINGGSRIGRNARMMHNVTLGMKNDGAPFIGDNAYFGTGAVLLGGIKLGDNVRIGANAVVDKDFPSNVTIAGIPARIVKVGSNSGVSNSTYKK